METKTTRVSFEKMTEQDRMSSDETEPGNIKLIKRLKLVLNRFAERTSMHGCGYIQTSRGRFTKTVWCAFTIVAILTLIVHLYMITFQYMKWPKQTTVSLEFNNLRFPAVTICNVNVLKKSELPKYASKELLALVSAVNPKALLRDVTYFSDNDSEPNSTVIETGRLSRRSKRSVSDFYGHIQWTQFDEDSTIQAMGMPSEEEEGESEWIAERSPFSLVWDVFRYLYMLLSKEDRAASGHNITDMLLECLFNGMACYASDFTLSQTPSYGNCYTIDSDKMLVKRPGPDGGLTVLLYLQTADFIDGITNGFGAKVVIHEPGTSPLPDDEGAFVFAAGETDISLKRTVISRLGQPWGECETGEDFWKKYGLNYTVKLCHVACQAIHVWETCKCWHHMYELIAEQMKVPFNICKTSSEKKCLLDAMSAYYRKELQCDCMNPCFDAQYSVSISARQWPSKSYAAILTESVCKTVPTECKQMRSVLNNNQLERNFLLLHIYYETLNFEQIVEKALIDPFTFLSSIGGALGLWIGLSMLSFCEVLQLMVNLMMSVVAELRRKKNRSRA